MTSGKKKRLSMLDSLASAGAPSPAPPPAPATPMMSANRALRSARDAVDAHHVWELDPATISDDRLTDRLDPADVLDLRDAIETNGQTVPILVRRDPTQADHYLLVYGRRRLEAIKSSEKIIKIKALVANLDDDTALRAQISENMARRDLSYIEKALFAQELVKSGFGTQSQVAEVLTVTKSAISMGLAIVDMIGPDLARAIGPAHGIGRPKWEALGKSIDSLGADRGKLARVASEAHDKAAVAMVVEESGPFEDPSVLAFEAVSRAVGTPPGTTTKPASPAPSSSFALKLGGRRGGSVKRTTKGLSISLEGGAFADWVEAEAQELIEELHARWLQQAED